MLSFIIGENKTAYLKVQAYMHSHPDANDYWDGNWIDTVIEILVGGFRASFGACLRSEDFVHLYQGLEQLYSSLHSNYKFETMEEQLTLFISGDGRGHFEIKGIAIDKAGDGNELRFILSIDQTFIPDILSEIKEIIEQFPVKGSPN